MVNSFEKESPCYNIVIEGYVPKMEESILGSCDMHRLVWHLFVCVYNGTLLKTEIMEHCFNGILLLTEMEHCFKQKMEYCLKQKEHWYTIIKLL